MNLGVISKDKQNVLERLSKKQFLFLQNSPKRLKTYPVRKEYL
jgi:hypothetical protein